MTLNDNLRGKLFLGLGMFSAVFFLVGGGVLTATNGAYWTAVFLTAYLGALLLAGPFLFGRIVEERVCRTPWVLSQQQKRRRQIAVLAIAAVSIVASNLFINSPAFTTTLGMHSFMIVMGVCLSFFVPLGLGMLHRTQAVTVEARG